MGSKRSHESNNTKLGLEGRSVLFPANDAGNLMTVHDDNEFTVLMRQLKLKKTPAVISYGASWCHICHDMLPTFYKLSSKYSKSMFIYVDVDECPEATKDVRYTPTFRFIRDGDRVDEFYGAGQQRLRDRAWLHF
eukprot:TRINITY_DN8316_c2_g2_i3.p1 TRINITY_DN8316_c2_g2~~TRINITY_DN8316_c2_g2_i3.p1  ORF type:complete len:135 (+),score=20.54 TRINITY_DN8316_c2_g2_i3:195-599(+)